MPLATRAGKFYRLNGPESGGMGRVESRLGDGVGPIVWESPRAALLAIAEQLRVEEVPLADLLTEMIVASSSAGDGLPRAVRELLAEPMTGAESVGALLLATTAARARDEGVDDEGILRTLALAATFVARFETYVAERAARPAS